MIGTAYSVININYTYTPETTTAKTYTGWYCYHCGYTNHYQNSQCAFCGIYFTSAAPKPPKCICSAIIKEWDTPEEDAAWQYLNEVKPKE